jgi:hypothetical protein
MFPTIGFQIITEAGSTEDFPFLEVPSNPIDFGTFRQNPAKRKHYSASNLPQGFTPKPG